MTPHQTPVLETPSSHVPATASFHEQSQPVGNMVRLCSEEGTLHSVDMQQYSQPLSQSMAIASSQQQIIELYENQQLANNRNRTQPNDGLGAILTTAPQEQTILMPQNVSMHNASIMQQTASTAFPEHHAHFSLSQQENMARQQPTLSEGPQTEMILVPDQNGRLGMVGQCVPQATEPITSQQYHQLQQFHQNEVQYTHHAQQQLHEQQMYQQQQQQRQQQKIIQDMMLHQQSLQIQPVVSSQQSLHPSHQQQYHSMLQQSITQTQNSFEPQQQNMAVQQAIAHNIATTQQQQHPTAVVETMAQQTTMVEQAMARQMAAMRQQQQSAAGSQESLLTSQAMMHQAMLSTQASPAIVDQFCPPVERGLNGFNVPMHKPSSTHQQLTPQTQTSAAQVSMVHGVYSADSQSFSQEQLELQQPQDVTNHIAFMDMVEPIHQIAKRPSQDSISTAHQSKLRRQNVPGRPLLPSGVEIDAMQVHINASHSPTNVTRCAAEQHTMGGSDVHAATAMDSSFKVREQKVTPQPRDQAASQVTSPVRSIPSELGYPVQCTPAPSQSVVEKTNVSSKEFEDMSREQLIARLMELETEKRAGSLQNSPDASKRMSIDESPRKVTFNPLENGSEMKSETSTYVDDEEEEGPPTPLDEDQQNGEDAVEDDEELDEEEDEDEDGDGDQQGLLKEQVQCRWKDCGQKFDELQQLISHIRDSHVGSGKPTYTCEWEGCARNQKPFTKRHKMYNHLRTHTGERPFVCTKPGCEKRFSRPDSLTTHIKTHSNVRPFICPAKGCGKAYYHSRSLKKHERIHDAHQEAATPYTTAPSYSFTGSVPSVLAMPMRVQPQTGHLSSLQIHHSQLMPQSLGLSIPPSTAYTKPYTPDQPNVSQTFHVPVEMEPSSVGAGTPHGEHIVSYASHPSTHLDPANHMFTDM
ncbi:hypothetical protein EC973_008108 [Apophysomyces ossiformis]|uniref:C2H2-type domain-containing protein n=1 Tax=Apophysomyces ossiformis TaxID=679940 RepID=A0A8H7ETU3_9FUNG|nr:hypothetical protein EC973_008108 [Apophysomyces ossiformis]